MLPLSEALIKSVTTKKIRNTYYDDENYNSCETEDLNAAYDVILELCKDPQLLHTTLTEKTAVPNSSLETSVLTHLKIALQGDFESQLRTTSSPEKHAEALIALVQSLPPGPLWTEAIPIPSKKEAARVMESPAEQWRFVHAMTTPLIHSISDQLIRPLMRMKWCTPTPSELNWVIAATKPLQKIPEFYPTSLKILGDYFGQTPPDESADFKKYAKIAVNPKNTTQQLLPILPLICKNKSMVLHLLTGKADSNSLQAILAEEKSIMRAKKTGYFKLLGIRSSLDKDELIP